MSLTPDNVQDQFNRAASGLMEKTGVDALVMIASLRLDTARTSVRMVMCGNGHACERIIQIASDAIDQADQGVDVPGEDESDE